MHIKSPCWSGTAFAGSALRGIPGHRGKDRVAPHRSEFCFGSAAAAAWLLSFPLLLLILLCPPQATATVAVREAALSNYAACRASPESV